ncbi:hypothetical protein ABEF94_006531 [Exophiala dermatitidis]
MEHHSIRDFFGVMLLMKCRIKSGYVGGDQARIMLQLAINAGYSLDQIRDLFEGPLRNAIYGPYANQLFYGLVPNPDGIF